MKRSRRSFLRTAAGAALGIGTVGTVPELSTAETRRWKELVANVSGSIDDDEKTDHDEASDPSLVDVPDHLFSSAHVELLEVFKTDTYGWEAYVGLTGCAQSLQHYVDDDEWYPVNNINQTQYDVLNGDPSFDPPVVDEGYRGFTPEGSQSDINIPDWVEPSFDIGVSTLVSFASSSPWTGAGAAVALSADDIIEALGGENGKSSIGDDVDGYRVSYSPENCIGPLCFGKSDSEMTHYQRINGRFGSFEPGTELEIDSRFSTERPPNNDVEVSFDVYIWDEDGGFVTSNSTDTATRPENLSKKTKQEVGYVELSGGTATNPVVQNDKELSSRIDELVADVDDREVEAVLLDPPSKIE